MGWRDAAERNNDMLNVGMAREMRWNGMTTRYARTGRKERQRKERDGYGYGYGCGKRKNKKEIKHGPIFSPTLPGVADGGDATAP
jgi:hypothetical protein